MVFIVHCGSGLAPASSASSRSSRRARSSPSGRLATRSAVRLQPALGVPPPTPTLGGVLAGGQVFLAMAWWISTFPGLLLLAIVLAVNVLGDTLRNAMAPTG